MGVWDQVDIDFLEQARHRGAARLHDQGLRHAIAARSPNTPSHASALQDTPEELMQEWDDMASVAYSTTVEAKPGALDYLRDLKSLPV